MVTPQFKLKARQKKDARTSEKSPACLSAHSDESLELFYSTYRHIYIDNGKMLGFTWCTKMPGYPNMFPSNIDAAYSLTAHNSASSPLTLKIMLVVVLIFVPIVLAYQIWTYNLFKGKVTEEDVAY
jgi:hypothetical protein